MAEGLVNHYYNKKFQAFSAGAITAPIHPLTKRVMGELGIDITKQRSKSIKEYFGLVFDYVITLCGKNARSVCPVFTGKAKRRLNWNFDDPAEAKGKEEEVIQVFRRVRDEIKVKINELVKRLEKETGI
jgi:arsenate reductase